MKVFITGGTGFIGSRLVAALVEAGHQAVILTRSRHRAAAHLPAGVTFVEGDPALPGAWQAAVAETDAAVNLVGESIFGRWTPEKKTAIMASRVEATRRLVESLPPGRVPAFTLVSGSAVGYYGWRGDEPLSESSPPGSDFLAGLAVRWEEEALKASAKGARVVLLRTGIVLGHGGALDQMVRPFKLYGGGPIGTGRQYFSWVHLEDEVGLILFALERPQISGPLNATAPKPVTNAEFSHLLGEVLHRPAWMHVPAFTIRMALGEFADVILNGQRVLPDKALRAGYLFRHPDLRESLADLLGAHAGGG